MRRFRSLAFTIALISRCVGEQPDPEREAILKVEDQWCAAYLHRDVEFLSRFLVDDYTLTNGRGEISTKADDLRDAKAGQPNYEVFENHEMKIRLYGDTALVTGVTVVGGTADGTPFHIVVRFTDTLARINGEWRGVAGHTSKHEG